MHDRDQSVTSSSPLHTSSSQASHGVFFGSNLEENDGVIKGFQWNTLCDIFIIDTPQLVLCGKMGFVLWVQNSGPWFYIKCCLARYGNRIMENRVSISRPSFPGMWIPMLKIRQWWDRLIFNMGMPILVRRHLYIEMPPPECCKIIFFPQWDFINL